MIWMPYQDYRRSAKCLSDQDLRDQRIACRRLIGVMFNKQRVDFQSWMLDWTAEHSDAVLWITDATLEEMARRKMPGPLGVCPWMLLRATDPPPWLGNEAVHRKHQTMLLERDPRHYGKMRWRT